MNGAVRSSFWAALFTLVVSTSCAYVLPATWRSFRADPDDAAPAITRALDDRKLSIVKFNQTDRTIETQWVSSGSGVTKTRERFIIRWERDAQERALTIYVRHEAQDQDVEDQGVRKWGTPYHDARKEDEVLDLIERELKRGAG